VKLADCRKVGVTVFALGVVCDMMGGPGRRREFWYPVALVESSDWLLASMWFEPPPPPPPMDSSEFFPFAIAAEEGEW
jgi:hypothetical protein